jgi:hypothetical protein
MDSLVMQTERTINYNISLYTKEMEKCTPRQLQQVRRNADRGAVWRFLDDRRYAHLGVRFITFFLSWERQTLRKDEKQRKNEA